jgi:hypothetical protein
VAGFQIGLVVEPKGEIRFAKLCVEASLEQCTRSVTCLLGRLRHKHDRAVPLIFQLRKRASRANECGNMRVVSAGVHYGDILAFVILGRDFACVGQTRFLFHG